MFLSRKLNWFMLSSAALFSLFGMGCAGPMLAPTPNLYWATGEHPYDDVPEVYRTTQTEIIYATDRIREDLGAGRLHYGYGRSHSLALGVATVSMGGDEMTWEQLAEASTVRNRSREVPLELTGVREFVRLPPSNTSLYVVDDELVEPPDYLAALVAANAEAAALINSQLAKSPVKDVYVYVHGYNNTFEYAAFRMATIWHFLGRQGVPVLYSWPAGHPGALQGYNYDRESSEFTIFHLKQPGRIVFSMIPYHSPTCVLPCLLLLTLGGCVSRLDPGPFAVLPTDLDPAALRILTDAVEVMGGIEAIGRIKSIYATADCTSPRGPYRTTVQSLPPDSVFFDQITSALQHQRSIVGPENAWAVGANGEERTERASVRAGA